MILTSKIYTQWAYYLCIELLFDVHCHLITYIIYCLGKQAVLFSDSRDPYDLPVQCKIIQAAGHSQWGFNQGLLLLSLAQLVLAGSDMTTISYTHKYTVIVITCSLMTMLEMMPLLQDPDLLLPDLKDKDIESEREAIACHLLSQTQSWGAQVLTAMPSWSLPHKMYQGVIAIRTICMQTL